MKILAQILLNLLLLVGVQAAYIDSTRLIPGGWSPGIPGGIDSLAANYVLFCDVTDPPYNCPTDGTSDASLAINNAIAACPSNGIVYIPAGTFVISNTIRVKSFMMLKGAGSNSTFLTLKMTGQGIAVTNSSSGSRWTEIVAGKENGSTNITLAASANWPGEFHTNWICVIGQTNQDTNILITLPGKDSYTWGGLKQYNRILSINGQQATLERPLYFNYSVSTNITVLGRPSYGYSYVMTKIGIEDMTLSRPDSVVSHNINLSMGHQCWIRRVYSNRCRGGHFKLDNSYQCEVRQNTAYGFWNGGGNTSYGVWLYNNTTDCLIEDNIFINNRHAMVTEVGCQGNVFGYNYSREPINESQLNTDFLMLDAVTHSGVAMFNLWEGNVFAKGGCDFENGNAMNNMFFRNWSQRYGLATVNTGLRAFEVQTGCYTNNFVGNIMMTNGMNAVNYEWVYGQASGGSVWCIGGNVASVDPRLADTIFRHFNYDLGPYQSNQLAVGYTTNDVPDSLYLGTRTNWLYNYCALPRFGPDVETKTNMIPAVARYLGVDYGEGTTPPVLITPVITWGPIADIMVGTALSGTQLNATCDQAGTLTYDPAAGTVLAVGESQALKVTFTPTDPLTVASGEKWNVITVIPVPTKTDPTISWTPPGPITYGTLLSVSQLNATANVDGDFEYDPTFGELLEVGTHTLTAVFLPDDTESYNIVTNTVPLLVNAAPTPSVTVNVTVHVIWGSTNTPNATIRWHP